MNKTIHRSQRIYRFLLKFYPKNYQQEFAQEMSYVFLKTLETAHITHGTKGIINAWARTVSDYCKSLIMQHLEHQKGVVSMKLQKNDIIMQNKTFLWIAVATGLILLVPFLAMQYQASLAEPVKPTDRVDWSPTDFIIMAILLFGTGSLFVLAARKVNKKYRLILGIAFAIMLLLIWAELAVGVFGTPFAGS